MAESYRKVERSDEYVPLNEIRIRRGVGIGRYLKRAYELFQNKMYAEETVIIKGVSNAA